MADFHQSGVVTTLHRLNSNASARVESELESLSAKTPIGLVLPALYSEFETPSMQRIVPELRQAPYIRDIVVVLARATKSEYELARSLFQHFPHKVTFIWIDSERIQDLFALLEKRKLSAGSDGKGRSCWLAYGYLLAAGECDTIAVHDCDILNYDRSMLARLLYPVANPAFNFEFCKGYYARIGDRMHGRVTRLFMAPLLHALNEMAPGAPFLRFLESFRYPLAGEFAIKAKLARVNRLPGDWGLEVGVLAEVYRNCSPERTCQVDLADNYEHKHQSLSADDPAKGLRRMSADIAKALFRALASEGLVFTQDHCRSLEVRYTIIVTSTMGRSPTA
jgi:glucosyl-3-phosphoglycerate synthase